MVVHAYGAMRAIEDAAWLREFVAKLTDRFEAPRAQPWAITDAPEDFIATHLRAIVGLEIQLTRLVGKWKTSQNRPVADREGVVAGLRDSVDASAQAMASVIEKNRS